MIRAGIIGATGYTGIELLRLLHAHKSVEVTKVFTESYVGQKIIEIYPHLNGHIDFIGEKLDLAIIDKNCDVVFISLPHGHAIDIIPHLLAMNKKIIDLGADFRLKNSQHYQQWYQHQPASSELLNLAVYGLPEICNRKIISNASLIANPGCYPTATLLAVVPALKAGIIEFTECIFDAKSGVSGAGRTLSLNSHYCEVTENLAPYQIGGLHRHVPEIEEQLALIANQLITIQFTPHLVPMIRGLLVTCYLKLKTSTSLKSALAIYEEAYKNEPFIRICPPGKMPQTKQVRGSNYCDLAISVDARTQRLIVISVIDNLIKGASGQAIQNMNLMYQLPEDSGLNNLLTTYP